MFQHFWEDLENYNDQENCGTARRIFSVVFTTDLPNGAKKESSLQ